MTQQAELIKVDAEEFGVTKTRAEQIEAVFVPMVAKLKEFDGSYDEIIKEAEGEITQEVCKKASRLRKDIAKVRIEAEKVRKAEKEEYLRAGKAIDGVANILKFAVSDKEKALTDIEKHFENLERERIAQLNQERIDQVAQYEVDAEHLDLGNMADDVWQNYLSGVKSAYEQKVAAEKKAEEERIAREKAEAEERERIRKENEALKAEKAKREAEEKERLEKERIEKEKQEAALKAEREEAERKQREIEAKLESERKERERIEQERLEKERAEKEAAEKAEQERIAAQQELERADDDKKVDVFLGKLREVYSAIPELKDKARAKKIKDALSKLAELCKGE